VVVVINGIIDFGFKGLVNGDRVKGHDLLSCRTLDGSIGRAYLLISTS